MFKLLFSIILIMLLAAPSLFARSPAVEPVMGLSLEENVHLSTPPEKWPDFSQDQPAEEIPAPTQLQVKPNIRAISTNDLTESTDLPPYLAILITLLPFAVLGGVLLPLAKNHRDSKADQKDPKDDAGHDRQWPKAS